MRAVECVRGLDLPNYEMFIPFSRPAGVNACTGTALTVNKKEYHMYCTMGPSSAHEVYELYGNPKDMRQYNFQRALQEKRGERIVVYIQRYMNRGKHDSGPS